MKNILNSIRPSLAIPLWGIIGGLSLIIITGQEQHAKHVIPIFALTLLLSIATTKHHKPKSIFKAILLNTLSVFLIMFIIDYLYIITIVNPFLLSISLFGHLWRIAIVIAIGLMASSILTYIYLSIKKDAKVITS